MDKNLVIVESPSKAKTINKYLGKDYIVEATVGHIKNLPKSKLGIDVENGFDPQYIIIRGKAQLIKKIKGLASKSNKIYIATDPDREGEAIAQDIADVLDIKGKDIYRVLFNEITKTGVKKAMQDPRSIDDKLVASQRARRIMDRIIGYKISPFLWRAVLESSDSSLSAGRVQSVALRLICEKEEEILKFKTSEYWSLWAIFEKTKNEIFKAKLHSVNNKEIKIKKTDSVFDSDKYFSISNEEEALALFNKIKNEKDFVISNITKRKSKRNPSPPFITSTLQVEASRRLRMRPKQTMMLAQKLYEGIDLGKEGSVGLITYMRTDSTRLSEEIVKDARDLVQNTYGKEYIPESPNVYDKKKANVQDAHEAIRPTSLKYSPEFVKPFLDVKSFQLYELIWKRFLASQMSSALMEVTVIEITAGEFLFKAFGSAVLFNGYMQLYEEIAETKDSDDKNEERNEIIPAGLEKNDNLNLNELSKTQHFTKPPARFTESSLIKELENKGIGRPSTYASIVSTIQDRNYVEVQERKLFPTSLGLGVNKILVSNFPDIIDVNFTAGMEFELDQIAQGESEYIKVLNDFYYPFTASLKKVESNIEKIYCDKCGSEMTVKIGRFGKYLACTNYPECKNIKSLKQKADKNQEPEYTGETCPKCGSRTIFRKGKFGKFIGCEKYPGCDFIKNITLGIKCPKCKKGEITALRSKRGKAFYGCTRYPECDFVSWNKPVLIDCPNNDSEYMEHKYSVKKGNYLVCPVCGEEVLQPQEEES